MVSNSWVIPLVVVMIATLHTVAMLYVTKQEMWSPRIMGPLYGSIMLIALIEISPQMLGNIPRVLNFFLFLGYASLWLAVAVSVWNFVTTGVQILLKK